MTSDDGFLLPREPNPLLGSSTLNEQHLTALAQAPSSLSAIRPIRPVIEPMPNVAAELARLKNDVPVTPGAPGSPTESYRSTSDRTILLSPGAVGGDDPRVTGI